MLTFSQTLTQYATDCALSDRGMAQLLGVPLTTYRHWLTSTSAPDRAATRLVAILTQVNQHAPDLHASLIAEARLLAPESATRGRGRPRKLSHAQPVADGAQVSEPAPGAAIEAQPVPEVPDWLCGSPAPV